MDVAVAGATISFIDAGGDGPLCLFLCSYGTEPAQRQTPSQLRAVVRPVFVDLRGTGASTGDPTDLTFDVLVADLEAVLEAIGIDRAVVFGHSIISVLAIEAGRRMNAPVIAVGAPPFGDMQRLAALGQEFFATDASDERKRILRDNLAELPPRTSPAEAVFAQTPMRFFHPRFDAEALFVGSQFSSALLTHVMSSLTATWEIGPLPMPVLLAHGRYDYVVPHTLWTGKVPEAAAFHLFERSGHQPFVEEPGAFADAVSHWLPQLR